MDKIVAEQNPEISISIVSHRQINLIVNLLQDIEKHCHTISIELILTLNLAEPIPIHKDGFSFPIRYIHNGSPKGFAENHNQAFSLSTGKFFCVMNPDIRLNKAPFPTLIACLNDTNIGVVAPIVVSESGAMEDSARHFPTPFKILCKVFGGCRGSDYVVNSEPIFPDWVGGMFMLFRREIFEKIGGFDQRYFLYYEDVDICARLRLRAYVVALCPAAKVIHHARRSSHRNLKYLKWHLSSMIRFFLSRPFLKIFWQRLTKQSS